MIKIFRDKFKLTIFLAVLWQLISVGLIATGVWAEQIVFFNLGLLAILFLVLPLVEMTGLFLLSLPFMVVLPVNFVSGFPMWRILLVWLFLISGIKYLTHRHKVSKPHSLVQFIINETKYFWTQKLKAWDKWLVGLFSLAIISLAVARFPAQGAKQIIFLLNAYLIYLVCLLAVDSSEKLKALLYYLKLSLLITVLLGYLQYLLTLFFSPYYFWQYWATLISSVYYGNPLGEVLTYSNSWFSANGSNQSLRMFGVLQDTHAFSVVVIFSMALWLARAKIKTEAKSIWETVKSQTVWFWVGLVILGFAVIASGTRGVWLAMLAPIVVSLGLMIKYRAKILTIFPLVSYAIIIVLFILSPWISVGLNWFRTVNTNDNFLGRASSIYDLSESSNVGRLEIWKSSINFVFHHPLGTGYGNFITSITEPQPNQTYEQLASEKNIRFNLPQKFITAHSLYLEVLVELGLVGILFFGLMWLSLFTQLWAKLKSFNFQANYQTKLILNLGLIVIWLLAYGLFDVTILNERVLLYLMVVIAALNLLLETKELNS